MSIRAYLEIAALLILGIGFALFTHHERSVGAAKVVASDAKAVTAQEQRDTALRTTAALRTSIANGDYNHEIALPVTGAPVPDRLCSIALNSRTVSDSAGKDGSGAAVAADGGQDAGTSQPLQQFADDALTIARDADAQIKALQADNDALRTEMENANGKL